LRAVLESVGDGDAFIKEVSGHADLGKLLVGELLWHSSSKGLEGRARKVGLLRHFSSCAWFRGVVDRDRDGGKRLIRRAVEAADPFLVRVAAGFAALINKDVGGWYRCSPGVDMLAKTLVEVGASLTPRQIRRLGLLDCLGVGRAVLARLRVVAELQPNWRGVTVKISSSGTAALFALERGALLKSGRLEKLLKQDAFTAEELRVLARFGELRGTLVREALQKRNLDLLRALAPLTCQEVGTEPLQAFEDSAWVTALGEAQPDWSCCAISESAWRTLRWSDVTVAARRGCQIDVQRVGDFGRRVRIGPEEAVELARIDRRLGFTAALLSGDREVLEALREAGFVPTAEELGVLDWFPVWRRPGLDAIAALQPDWSRSLRAAESITRHGDARAWDLARLHRAPGFCMSRV
jgi:hypothetical protein